MGQHGEKFGCFSVFLESGKFLVSFNFLLVHGILEPSKSNVAVIPEKRIREKISEIRFGGISPKSKTSSPYLRKCSDGKSDLIFEIRGAQ